MRLPHFELIEPGSLEEAVSCLNASGLSGQGAGAVILAGGTDLLVNLKHGHYRPEKLVTLRSVPELQSISSGPGGLRIGAMTTLDEVYRSEEVRRDYPALARAAYEVASPLLRTRATVGGNLCLDTRCRYFNQSEFWRSGREACYKAGGRVCHVTTKPGVCYATYSGDLAPALMALGATAEIAGPSNAGPSNAGPSNAGPSNAGPSGIRVIPLAGLFTGDGKFPSLCSHEPGLILVSVNVPKAAAGGKSGGKSLYRKIRRRGSVDFPLVGLGVWVSLDGEVCREARLAATGVGTAPVELRRTAALLTGRKVTTELTLKAGQEAASEIKPIRTGQTQPSYQKRVLAVAVTEALGEIFGLQPDLGRSDLEEVAG